MTFKIAQTVADMSASIQVFLISHNNNIAHTETLDLDYHNNDIVKDILKAFSIPWNR